MSEQQGSKSNFVPVLVAIVTGIATIVSAYIAAQKSNQNTILRGTVSNTEQELNHISQKYDSLLKAHTVLGNSYNELVERYKEGKPAEDTDTLVTITAPPTGTQVVKEEEDEKIFNLPTLAKSREQSHYVLVKRAIGDKKNKQVIVKFLSINERYDGNESLYMYQSIGTFQGTTYYAVRGKLGDKLGEGQDQSTTPGMQTVKGEPTYAHLVLDNVPSTVSEFSKLIIHINGDRVPFKNIPITWQ